MHLSVFPAEQDARVAVIARLAELDVDGGDKLLQEVLSAYSHTLLCP